MNLNDGSYSTTKIYPVIGLPGHERERPRRLYVQLDGSCATTSPGLDRDALPGDDTAFVDDGFGGRYLQGTFDLTVVEATGRFRSLVGGHNHMVDKLHFLAPGDGSGGKTSQRKKKHKESGRPGCVHWVAVRPPSSVSTWPVTNADASEQKKRIAPTRSSGSAILRSGIRATRRS